MTRPRENKNCPYCLGPVQPDEERVRCPKCGVIHHADCWQANGACSVYGCDGWAVWNSRISDKMAPVAPEQIDVSTSDAAPAQGTGFACMKCGAPVKRNQLVCWKCRHDSGETHHFENCFGPAAVLMVGFVSTIVMIVRAVT